MPVATPAETMQGQDEFICGSCGATSSWRESYYQANTPDGPGASLPKAGYGDISAWYSREHYRAFCPRCGDMVADDGPDGMQWTDGARPKMADKLPAQGGGKWILCIEDFVSCLVPRQGRTLDIEGFKRAEARLAAAEEGRRKASIPDLIDKLRASKGRMAGDIEGELSARGAEAVPYLVTALKDPEVYLRWRTCYVLKAMGRQAAGARPSLVEALRDQAESVRSGAEDALRSIGPVGAADKAKSWWRLF
jgi:hypothetical protein